MIKLFELIRSFFIDFFGFSKRESNGALVLLVLIALILFFPLVFKKIYNKTYQNFESDQKLLNEVLEEMAHEQSRGDSINVSKASISKKLFVFNPNSIDLEELTLLGISDQVAKRVINYRSKGGTFKVKADLKKIYGLSEDKYHELYDYIDLPEKQISSSSFKPTDLPKKEVFTKKKEVLVNFDINKADTNQLKEIKGIGTVLSNRIIKYRESLGGFLSPDQVREVYGLEEEPAKLLISRTFISDDFLSEKIMINAVDVENLASHPYVNKKIASRIIAYRSHHGPFSSAEDLKKVKEVDEEVIARLAPYLSFE